MPPRVPALDIWMNGLHVGRWERSRAGVDRLIYERAWMDAPEGRPLSLSLPWTGVDAEGRVIPLATPAVGAYFENLLPDNERILRRLRERYGAASTAAFDMLAMIGRDCVGAVQLVPAGQAPGEVRRINAEPIDDAAVAQLLRDTTLSGPLGRREDDAFRLSIAGAQEKAALMKHQGRWCIPRDATPSTHIFKLPLGVVGNMRADMRDSVENEWLCMEMMREFGLSVARVEMGLFEDQKALVVERFDRTLSRDRRWWLRNPQEDFCQAFGVPPDLKYEADGGPCIQRIMEWLRGSENAAEDRRAFFKTQLLFWLMAATDGHAKNFSLHVLPRGAYRMTPLYDIVSAYPIMGAKTNQLDPRKAKLAMAVVDHNRHYDLYGIHRWHWVAMGEKLGLADIPVLIDDIVRQVPAVAERIAMRLPAGFPAPVFDAIRAGMLQAARRLEAEPNRR